MVFFPFLNINPIVSFRMAPEVIKDQAYSKKSDVWAFGVFLWETLSCCVPFGDCEGFVVMYAVRHLFESR